jgi:pyruvate dehydrogenase E1 component beta subunit
VKLVKVTVRDALRDAMAEEMRRDPDVFLMGEEVAQYQGAYKVSRGLLDEFGPKRVLDTPISEASIVSAAVGAALSGLRPVVEIMYEDFLTLAMEQLVNQAAKHRTMSGGQVKVPLTIRTQGGAGWSPGAQHAQQLEAWFVHVPGLKVVFASTPEDVRGLLWSSIYDDNPVVFFEHRTLYPLKGEVPDELEPIPLGKARVHQRRALVDAPPDRPDDAVDDRADVILVAERDPGALDLPLALDEDPVRPVHHDLVDLGVRHQRLEPPEAKRARQHPLYQRLALLGLERLGLIADQLGDPLRQPLAIAIDRARGVERFIDELLAQAVGQLVDGAHC